MPVQENVQSHATVATPVIRDGNAVEVSEDSMCPEEKHGGNVRRGNGTH